MVSPAEITNAYIDMVEDYMRRGYTPYLLTFMFKPMNGSERSMAARMEREVERVYAKILTRVVRRPRTAALETFPVWIICADWPVPKRMRDCLLNIAINDGRHLHVVALMPPVSRMRGSLADHIDECQVHYSGREQPLTGLDAVPITETPRKATGYAIKSVKRRRVEVGDVVILPRTQSEMPSR